jgi:hypothetical protein
VGCKILYCFHRAFFLTIQFSNKCTHINNFYGSISIDVVSRTVVWSGVSLHHSTQQHAKQHAYNQQQIQYHDSVHQVTNAAILNIDFNLYDKSFTILQILQTQNVLKTYY